MSQIKTTNEDIMVKIKEDNGIYNIKCGASKKGELTVDTEGKKWYLGDKPAKDYKYVGRVFNKGILIFTNETMDKSTVVYMGDDNKFNYFDVRLTDRGVGVFEKIAGVANNVPNDFTSANSYFYAFMGSIPVYYAIGLKEGNIKVADETVATNTFSIDYVAEAEGLTDFLFNAFKVSEADFELIKENYKGTKADMVKDNLQFGLIGSNSGYIFKANEEDIINYDADKVSKANSVVLRRNSKSLRYDVVDADELEYKCKQKALCITMNGNKVYKI